MKKRLALAALLLSAAPAWAHDFWIQPEAFVLDAPATVPVTLFVGHGQDRSRWAVPREHILRFESIGPNGTVDHRDGLTMGAPDGDASLALTGFGAHVVALQSRNSFSDLEGGRFDAYVAKEGLAAIAQDRQARGTPLASGREFYSRRAKAIVQIGPVDAASTQRVAMPLGLELEIVPQRHPMALDDDRTLPLTVLYRGRPLNYALVKLTDLNDDSEPVIEHRTDRNGKTTIRIPHEGSWQLNVVWGEPLANDAKADYSTIFSSLSFASN
ncbi:MAG: DUF4198 domain-containing protein [Pontixanthobacter sp.]